MDKSSLKCSRGNLYYRQRNRQTWLYCIFWWFSSYPAVFLSCSKRRILCLSVRWFMSNPAFLTPSPLDNGYYAAPKRCLFHRHIKHQQRNSQLIARKKSSLFHFENEKSPLLITLGPIKTPPLLLQVWGSSLLIYNTPGWPGFTQGREEQKSSLITTCNGTTPLSQKIRPTNFIFFSFFPEKPFRKRFSLTAPRCIEIAAAAFLSGA